MKKRHYVVVTNDQDIAQLYPLKKWVREHSAAVGRTGGTSHQLKAALKNTGWIVQELEDQVLVIQPDSQPALAYVKELVAEPAIEEESDDESDEMLYFPLESHLRDFIAKNLHSMAAFGHKLQLFKDERGSGIEYPTEVGPIDILAQAGDGGFVVFELKLSRGPDGAVGQIARYMGWVSKNLTGGEGVRGIIVARTVDEKLKYAALMFPQVSLFEYKVNFDIQPATLSESQPITNPAFSSNAVR